jgi:predicted cupin superfamily sugar epimerase
MNDWVAARVAALGLEPHPEGGFFREVYRSSSSLPLPRGTRSLLTAIHFVLPPGGVSQWHRVRADEAWTLVGGDPLELGTLDDTGQFHEERLEPPPNGSPLGVVPAGLWQAARCTGRNGSHAVCVVAPGFDFKDFRLGSASELAAAWPMSAPAILRYAG